MLIDEPTMESTEEDEMPAESSRTFYRLTYYICWIGSSELEIDFSFSELEIDYSSKISIF